MKWAGIIGATIGKKTEDIHITYEKTSPISVFSLSELWIDYFLGGKVSKTLLNTFGLFVLRLLHYSGLAMLCVIDSGLVESELAGFITIMLSKTSLDKTASVMKIVDPDNTAAKTVKGAMLNYPMALALIASSAHGMYFGSASIVELLFAYTVGVISFIHFIAPAFRRSGFDKTLTGNLIVGKVLVAVQQSKHPERLLRCVLLFQLLITCGFKGLVLNCSVPIVTSTIILCLAGYYLMTGSGNAGQAEYLICFGLMHPDMYKTRGK